MDELQVLEALENASDYERAFEGLDSGQRGVVMLRFASFSTFLPAYHDTLDDYGIALTRGVLPGIPF